MRQIRVRLTEPHTHAGKDHLPGAELTLAEHDAIWLTDRRKAVLVRGRRTETLDTTDGADRRTGDHHE
jgi:hypothetical protein